MPKQRLSRETLLPAMAAYVLENGIAGVSLRPLAKAAGTSDRMLIYHFGNREGVVDALLEYITNLFSSGLDSALPSEPASDRKTTVARILQVTSSPELQPFFRLWWDIVAAAAAGNDTFRSSAAATMGQLLEWLEQNMPAQDHDPKGGARLLLTLIEGSQMLGAVGRQDIAEAALAALEG